MKLCARHSRMGLVEDLWGKRSQHFLHGQWLCALNGKNEKDHSNTSMGKKILFLNRGLETQLPFVAASPCGSNHECNCLLYKAKWNVPFLKMKSICNVFIKTGGWKSPMQFSQTNNSSQKALIVQVSFLTVFLGLTFPRDLLITAGNCCLTKFSLFGFEMIPLICVLLSMGHALRAGEVQHAIVSKI